MLVRLQNHDVNKFWPILKKALDTIGEGMEEPEKVLEALLDESVQCWLILDTEENLIGFVNTRLGSIEPQGTKIMEIRDLYSLNGIPTEVFSDANERLDMFARQHGCSKIVAYSDNPQVVARAKHFGFVASTVMIKEV